MLTQSGASSALRRGLCSGRVALLCVLLLFAVPVGADTFPQLPVEALSFSDHPERVRSRGLLFQGGLLPLKPVRFQYYHEGGREDGPLYLSVRVKNRGSRPARVHALAASGGPDPDYFTAGHQNNLRFLERLSRSEGTLHEIAPGETWQVDLHEMPLNQVVSGTVQMTLVEGTQVDYGLFAVHDPKEPIGFDLLSNPKDVHARGVYPAADQTLIRGWTVGEAEGYAALGAVRQPNVLAGPELKGDYGVVYRIRLALRNPGAQAARVQVLFNPRGGAATGTFLVRDEDGATRTWEVAAPVKAFERVPLGEIEVPARTVRTVEIWTMPEGASNYPVRLVLQLRRHESGAEGDAEAR